MQVALQKLLTVVALDRLVDQAEGALHSLQRHGQRVSQCNSTHRQRTSTSYTDENDFRLASCIHVRAGHDK